MNFLEFIFQSFWHFIGCVFLLAIVVQWKPFVSSRHQGLTTKQFNDILEELKKKKSK